MNSTETQLLRDQSIQITGNVLQQALGGAYTFYLSFINHLEIDGIQLNWRYYKDGKAWLGKGLYHWKGPRGAQKETTIFWLSIWKGFFRVSIFIHENYREEVMNLSIQDKAKNIVANSKQMGKTLKYFPLVFDISSIELLESIYSLFRFKKDHAK